VTKALFRDTLRAIRKTLSRFVSIVIIVALGVGFFAGLKAVSPNMKQAAVDFYRQHQLADVVVQSTVGFDENDVEAVLAMPGVKSATPSRSIDGILYKDETQEDGAIDMKMEQSMSGTSYVIRVIGYDFSQAVGSGSERLDQLQLVKGNWPSRPDECVVSVYANKMEPDRYKIGNIIHVRGDHEDLLDTVKSEYYKVVGTVYTPEFIAMELGPSQAGGGELSGYVYIPDQAFKIEYYTTLYIGSQAAAGKAAYTSAYNNAVRQLTAVIENAAPDVVRARAERIGDEYGPQIEQGKKDLETAKTEGKAQLEKAREDIAYLMKMAKDGPALFAKEKKAAEDKLAKAKADYEQGQKDYQANYAKYEKGLEEYKKGAELVNEHPDAMIEYENGKNQLERAQNSYEMAKMAVSAGRSAIRVANSAIASGDPQRIENALGILASYFPMTEEDQTVEGLQKRVDEAEKELIDQEAALKDAEKDLEDGKKQLKEAEALIGQLKKFQAAEKQLRAAKVQLDLAWAKLQAAPAQIEAGEKELAVTLVQKEKELAGAISKSQTAEDDLARAEEEYKTKVADGERKIRRYENQMAALPNAQWMVSDRDDFPGYTNYGNTSDNMEQFALVFPVLFFLIAALVSLTTMTRMVEDERTQLGVLKAAGYSAGAIAFKYLFYAFTAGLIGSVLGLAMGFSLIPIAIFKAYQILYLIPTMHPGFFLDTAFVGMAAALISTVGAVIFSVLSAMRHRPAELMRPKAPKAGKRIFLEFFPFLWKRLKFNGKVTARNLARNKKRVLMTFAGIMGCTALLLTGFGIGNSIGTMLDKQFGPESIMKFDGQALLQANMKAGDEAVLNVFVQPGRLENILPVYMKKMYAGTEAFGRQIDVTIAVPETIAKIPDFVSLRGEKSGAPITMGEEGCYINGKTAEMMNLKPGDKITIQSGAMKAEIPVAAITRNYVYHYIYLSPACYEKYFGVAETTYNVVLLKLNQALNKNTGPDKDIQAAKSARAQLGRDLSDTAEVITVVYNQSIIDSVGAMIKIMRNVIVAVFTVAAGALAFVVLYNLNNINIYERIRELATIKVLGFYDKEADFFIYRENIIITIFGILAGLALGVPIHGFVIRTAEIESMMFVRTLALPNYFAAAIITAIFAIGINLMMHKKIKEINMVEALKSVE
jgi:putative ABC transport system permease protein